MGTVRIALTRGFTTLIDLEDAPTVCRYRWHATVRGRYVYAARRLGKRGRVIYLHRFLLGGTDDTIDHRNGDTLDNRRANLRPATYGQNIFARHTRPALGIHFDPAGRKHWRGHVGGKLSPRFATIEEARAWRARR